MDKRNDICSTKRKDGELVRGNEEMRECWKLPAETVMYESVGRRAELIGIGIKDQFRVA